MPWVIRQREAPPRHPALQLAMRHARSLGNLGLISLVGAALFAGAHFGLGI